MTPSEIIAAATEASNTGSADELTGDAIQRFAAIIAAKQREKDSQILDGLIKKIGKDSFEFDPLRADGALNALTNGAAAIRGQE